MKRLPDLIEAPAALDEFVRELDDCRAFAIDIESNGFYNYRERTCVLTVSTPNRTVAIDSLKLWSEIPRFASAFSDSERQTLLHGASYDIASLKRDFGFTFSNIFDTMIAAQLLNHEKISLADLVLRYVGDVISKELQRYNWSERPLLEVHLAYLGEDTRHLFGLRDLLTKELADKDLLEEFRIECDVLAAQGPATMPGGDPEEYRRVKEARMMSETQRGAFKALYQARGRIAAEKDLAPFRVMGNATLVDIVRFNPKAANELFSIKGLNGRIVEQYGQTLLDAMRAGLADPQPKRHPDTEDDRDTTHRRPSPEERDITKRIKEWRTTEAVRRGVGIQAVLPTPAMYELLQAAPRTVDELSSIRRLGRKRLERYGAALLEFARQVSPPARR